MKFSEYRIAEGIKTAIAKLEYKKQTDIQYKSIPPILKGEDVLAIAQTGTGKTAAFAIPILDILQDFKEKQRGKDGIKCLIMVPTRELAVQIKEVFDEYLLNLKTDKELKKNYIKVMNLICKIKN